MTLRLGHALVGWIWAAFALVAAAQPTPPTAASAAAPASAPALATPPVARLHATVGLLSNFPPFESWPEGGRPQGLDVDLLEALAPAAQVDIDYRRFDRFDDLLAALQRGEVQLATSMARNAERLSWLQFTRSYTTVEQGMVGAASITSAANTPDLAGRRLAVVKGYASERLAVERFSMAPILRYDSVAAMLDALHRGEADLAFEVLTALQDELSRRPQEKLRVLRRFTFPQGALHFAAPSAQSLLIERLDDALDRLPGDTMARLGARWQQPPAPEAVPATAGAPAATVEAPLRVGYFPNDRPYSGQDDDGVGRGIGIEMMRAVARRAGLEVAAFVPTGLADGLKALDTGTLDVLMGITETAERRRKITFVGPYNSGPLAIVSRERYSIWNIDQLAGRKLALVKRFFATGFIRAMQSTIEIVDCKNFNDCMDIVEAGGADATLYGLHGLYERLRTRERTPLRITGVVDGLFDEDNLALTPSRAALALRLREALDTVLREDLPGIERAWADSALQPGVNWVRVWQAAGAVAVVLVLGALAWLAHARSLRREVARTREAHERIADYLAFMAHEVRNSLQSVVGAVSLMRRAPQGDAQSSPLLRGLAFSAQSTLGLLNGLLDRHVVERGTFKPELRSDSLERLLHDTVEEMRPAAAVRQIELACVLPAGTEGWWLVDALRVQQIVRNLIINAIKFSDHGLIRVSATVEPGERGGTWHRVNVFVADQGRGIPVDQQANVFAGGTRLQRERAGHGMGLALSRELARALGGDLTLDASGAGGSTFCLRLEAERTGVPEPTGAGPLRYLLLVEDSPVYGMLLSQAFASLGVAVQRATGVSDTFKLLAQPQDPPFDLVLCDAHLADGHISDLLEALPGLPRRAPPILGMTASIEPGEQHRLIAAGVRDVLTKDSDVRAFAMRVLQAASTLR